MEILTLKITIFEIKIYQMSLNQIGLHRIKGKWTWRQIDRNIHTERGENICFSLPDCQLYLKKYQVV